MAGWDTTARLLGIVRYRTAGNLDGALEALVGEGIGLVEVTLDTPGALDAVGRGNRSGWTIGVGTVLEPDQVDRSVEAGAAFVVSPGTLPDVIERALELGVDVVPGALTPTEVIRAHTSGAAAVKVFPAAVGGPSYLRALRGPLLHVPLVPTGGIAARGGRGVPRRGSGVRRAGRCARRQRAAGEQRGAAHDRRSRARGCRCDRERAVSGTPEVIALGETMLSLIATDGPLDQATTFHATHGGAESNTCVALVRSGTSAAWVSRVGTDPMGDRVLAALEREGVDLSWVRTDPHRPTGLMLRDTVGTVRYYRDGSAASALGPDDLREVPIEDAHAVFATGITPLLGRDPERAVLMLFRRARGRRVFDLNLRSGLWGSDRAVALLGPFLRSCDLVLGGVDEFRAFTPGETTEDLARAITDLGPTEVVVKAGRTGAGALDPAGRWHAVAPAPVRDVDPVGAGDAFDGGYLHARLAGAEVPEALAEGARCGAAVAATIGDADGVPRTNAPQK